MIFEQGKDPLDQPKKSLEEAFCEAMLGAMNALAVQPRPPLRLVIDNTRPGAHQEAQAEKADPDG